MNNLSNEQLKQIIETDHVQCGDAYSMARELLAYREAQGEPAAWEVKGILCHTLEEASIYVGEPEPLYTAPQLPAVPAVPAVPAEYSSDELGCFDGEWEMGYESGWNACRSTMLAAAPKPDSDNVTDNTVQQFESLSKRSANE